MLAGHVLLDSSVLINLFASGRERELLGSFTAGAGVCTAVEAESLYLHGEGGDPPSRIVLTPLIVDGLLRRHELASEREQALYVDLAADLDDGEAMTIAIAAERGFAVATDDRKARRIASERWGGGLPLLRTSEILFEWAQNFGADAPALTEVLRRIEVLARYRPAKDDPLRDWWSGIAG